MNPRRVCVCASECCLYTFPPLTALSVTHPIPPTYLAEDVVYLPPQFWCHFPTLYGTVNKNGIFFLYIILFSWCWCILRPLPKYGVRYTYICLPHTAHADRNSLFLCCSHFLLVHLLAYIDFNTVSSLFIFFCFVCEQVLKSFLRSIRQSL